MGTLILDAKRNCCWKWSRLGAYSPKMYSKLMRLLWYTNRSRPHILRLTQRRGADHSWMTKKACRRKVTQSE